MENVYMIQVVGDLMETDDPIFTYPFKTVVRIFAKKEDAEKLQKKMLKNLKENPKEFVFDFDKQSVIEDLTNLLGAEVQVIEHKLF